MARHRVTTLVAPLRRPRLRRLVGAFLVNELGDGIAVVVLPLLVYDVSGSGLLTGVTFAALRAVGVVGRPVGGLAADRFDRVSVLRVTFLVRAAVLAAGLLSGSDGVLVACLVLTAFVGAVDNPSGEAAIREDAREHAQQVATIRKFSRAMSGVVGLALGGLLVGLAGPEVAVGVDVATYAVALALLPAAGPAPPRPETGEARPPGGWTTAARRVLARQLVDARVGTAHLRHHRDLRIVAGTAALSAGLVTALLTVAVVWLDDLPGAPDGAYGVALSGYSTGALLGLLLGGLLVWRVTVPTMGARSLAACGLVCAAGVVGSDWRVLGLSWLLWGVVWGPFDVLGDMRLVELTPDHLLGRTYGGIGMLAAAGQVVGGVVAGALVDVTDPRALIIGVGGLFLLAAAVLTARRRRATTGGAAPRRAP